MLITKPACAKPAPLIRACAASHVIAAFILLSPEVAAGALLDVLALLPLLEVLVNHILTLLLPVPVLQTLKAELVAVCAGDELLICSNTESVTVYFRTELHIVVCQHFFVHFELFVFIEKCLICQKFYCLFS